MGIGDLYATNPALNPPDPNAPTIPWGSPQAAQLVKQQQTAFNNPNAPFDALGSRVDAAAAQRAGDVHFAGGAAGGGAGQPAAPTDPLMLPGAGSGGQVVKAHDVQLGSDAGIEAKKRAADEAKNAIDSVGRSKFEENEANAQAMAGYQGALRGGQMQQQTDDAATKAKVAGAYDDWKKAQDIDPEHYMSSMSTGKRMMLSIAAGLTAGGMSLRGQGGPNPILQQIEQETNRDIDAQKSKRDKAMSLYTHARENGLDEEKSHALAYQHNAELAKAGLDASVVGNASPVRLAEADQHKAAIDDASADYMNKAFGRAQSSVAGGGKGWTDAMAKEAQELMKTDHEKGGNMTIEQGMVNVARSHNLPFAGGPQLNNDRIAQPGAGAGRQAGVQMEHKRLLGRYDSALDQIDQSINHLKSGYSYGEDEKWGGIRTNIASEVGFLMHGGAAEGAVKQQLDNIGDLNQSGVGQSVRGHSTVKALETIRQQLALKRGQEAAAGASVKGGTGFDDTAKESDAAAAAGAVER